jgi:hypothetical protein
VPGSLRGNRAAELRARRARLVCPPAARTRRSPESSARLCVRASGGMVLLHATALDRHHFLCGLCMMIHP